MREVIADDIIYRFCFNEFGEIIYARDMIGGFGTVKKRKGDKVNIIKNGKDGRWKRIDFSERGVMKHTTPGVVGFVLSFSSMPIKTETCIHIDSSSSNPNDYRAPNLVYSTHSDSTERGAMRVFKNGKMWETRIFRRSGFKQRRFIDKNLALRFATRYHRWVASAALSEIWRGVGICADMHQIGRVLRCD